MRRTRELNSMDSVLSRRTFAAYERMTPHSAFGGRPNDPICNSRGRSSSSGLLDIWRGTGRTSEVVEMRYTVNRGRYEKQ